MIGIINMLVLCYSVDSDYNRWSPLLPPFQLNRKLPNNNGGRSGSGR